MEYWAIILTISIFLVILGANWGRFRRNEYTRPYRNTQESDGYSKLHKCASCGM